jgi:hypothetical protein
VIRFVGQNAAGNRPHTGPIVDHLVHATIALHGGVLPSHRRHSGNKRPTNAVMHGTDATPRLLWFIQHPRRLTMQSKHRLSIAALSTLFFAAAPAISHAESQTEWLFKQLRVSDGYNVLDDSTDQAYPSGNATREQPSVSVPVADSGAQGKAGTALSTQGTSGGKNPNEGFVRLRDY